MPNKGRKKKLKEAKMWKFQSLSTSEYILMFYLRFGQTVSVVHMLCLCEGFVYFCAFECKWVEDKWAYGNVMFVCIEMCIAAVNIYRKIAF